MLHIKVFNPATKPTSIEKDEIVQFLFDHLDEFGDDKADILKCVDYAVKDVSSFGGHILIGSVNDVIASIVIINKTGMKGYIPENILVYIATNRDFRGQGIGKAMMEESIKLANGSIALHVEPNNPAKFLYEKLGFTNKYLEMRLTK
ncbi:MAG: GNAT family N-acetyltransferase [Crocinitomicaceae bacterium]